MVYNLAVLTKNASEVEKIASMINDLTRTRYQWMELLSHLASIRTSIEQRVLDRGYPVSVDTLLIRSAFTIRTNDHMLNTMLAKYDETEKATRETADTHGTLKDLNVRIATAAKELTALLTEAETTAETVKEAVEQQEGKLKERFTFKESNQALGDDAEGPKEDAEELQFSEFSNQVLHLLDDMLMVTPKLDGVDPEKMAQMIEKVFTDEKPEPKTPNFPDIIDAYFESCNGCECDLARGLEKFLQDRGISAVVRRG